MKEAVDALGGPAMFGVLILGALLTLGTIAMLVLAQFSDSKFDAAQMFQDERDKTSSSKFVGLIAGMASVWVIIFLTVSGKLPTDLFIWWLAVVVLGKLGSEAISKFAPPSPGVVRERTATTETETTHVAAPPLPRKRAGGA